MRPNECELPTRGGAELRRSGGWARGGGARRKELRGGRGTKTPPRDPRGSPRPGRTRAPPSLARGGWAGGAALFRPESRRGARHLRPFPPQSPHAAASRLVRERPRPPCVDPKYLPCTYLVSSATFLTNRDVLGGRR